MKKLIIPLLLILTLLLGCNEKGRNTYVLLNSNLSDRTSDLIYLDDNFKEVKRTSLETNGLMSLYSKENNLSIIGPYNSEIVNVQNDNIKILNSELPHPLYKIFHKDKDLTIYNYDEKKDINFYSYKVDGEDSFRLSGYPISIVSHENYAYIYSRDFRLPEESQFSLEVVDLLKKEIINEIKIDGPMICLDMYLDENVLYLPLLNIHSGDSKIKIINLDNMETEDILISVNNIRTAYKYKENFYILFSSEENAIINKYNSNFSKVLASAKLENSIHHATFNKNKLFFVNKENDKTIFNSFDLEKYKIENSREVPTSISDFVILN